MIVRRMEPSDVADVRALSEQLGYPAAAALLRANLATLAGLSDHLVSVASGDERVLGWIHAARRLVPRVHRRARHVRPPGHGAQPGPGAHDHTPSAPRVELRERADEARSRSAIPESGPTSGRPLRLTGRSSPRGHRSRSWRAVSRPAACMAPA